MAKNWASLVQRVVRPNKGVLFAQRGSKERFEVLSTADDTNDFEDAVLLVPRNDAVEEDASFIEREGAKVWEEFITRSSHLRLVSEQSKNVVHASLEGIRALE